MLISGATGKVGQHLIKALQIKGVPFKALARTEASARTLAEQGVDTVRGDLSNPAAVESALLGADTFFLLGAPSAHQGTQELGAIQAAKAAGVRRVVKLSVCGAGVDSACAITREHARVEQELADSDIAWTSLRPTLFMQNWVAKPVFERPSPSTPTRRTRASPGLTPAMSPKPQPRSSRAPAMMAVSTS